MQAQVSIRASRPQRTDKRVGDERDIPNNSESPRKGYRGGTMKTWLTVAEGAEYAGVSRDTIYTACERRELNHARVGGRRAIRLKAAWIDSWLERHAQGTCESRENAPTIGT